MPSTQYRLNKHVSSDSTPPATGSPELTGVTVIDVLITGRATIPPMAGATKTPHQVGAGPMGAAG